MIPTYKIIAEAKRSVRIVKFASKFTVKFDLLRHPTVLLRTTQMSPWYKESRWIDWNLQMILMLDLRSHAAMDEDYLNPAVSR